MAYGMFSMSYCWILLVCIIGVEVSELKYQPLSFYIEEHQANTEASENILNVDKNNICIVSYFNASVTDLHGIYIQFKKTLPNQINHILTKHILHNQANSTSDVSYKPDVNSTPNNHIQLSSYYVITVDIKQMEDFKRFTNSTIDLLNRAIRLMILFRPVLRRLEGSYCKIKRFLEFEYFHFLCLDPPNISDSSLRDEIQRDIQLTSNVAKCFSKNNLTWILNFPVLSQISKWKSIMEYVEQKLDYDNCHSDFERGYLRLAIFLTIIGIGLVLNGILLLIFIRHKEVRTVANTMILNLAICDVLNICIGAPLEYTMHFPHNDPNHLLRCRIFITAMPLFSAASALSVLALCAQRYSVITNLKYFPRSPPIYVVLVWVISFFISIPEFLCEGIYSYLCSIGSDQLYSRVLFTVYGVIFCIILPIMMMYFSIATARKLKNSAESIPSASCKTARAMVRRRSARVVTSLALVFVVTYVPIFLWCAVAYWTDRSKQKTTMKVLMHLVKFLLFANGLFNPIALYMASGKFRKLFRRYLCCSNDETKIKCVVVYEGTSSTIVKGDCDNQT